MRRARRDAGRVPFRRPFPACPVVSAFSPFGPAFGQQDGVWGVPQCCNYLVPKFFRRILLSHFPASLYCDVDGLGFRLGLSWFWFRRGLRDSANLCLCLCLCLCLWCIRLLSRCLSSW